MIVLKVQCEKVHIQKDVKEGVHSMKEYAEFHLPQYKCTVRVHKGPMPEEQFKATVIEATTKLVKAQMRAHKAAKRAG